MVKKFLIIMYLNPDYYRQGSHTILILNLHSNTISLYNGKLWLNFSEEHQRYGIHYGRNGIRLSLLISNPLDLYHYKNIRMNGERHKLETLHKIFLFRTHNTCKVSAILIWWTGQWTTHCFHRVKHFPVFIPMSCSQGFRMLV